MVQYDGQILINTQLDTSCVESGINGIEQAARTGFNAVIGLAAAASVAVAGIGVAAVGVGSKFEASMSQVAATMGITAESIQNGDKDFQSLESAAMNAGATTQFSASQAGEALNYLALAGYDAAKAITALPTVLDLAAAGGIDLGYASDLVTDSMSALGLETEELESFVDELAKTSQKSNTNISQLGQGILTVGGTAKKLAGGTVELNTMLGILADNGIKGAEGGTALRNVILALSAPTDKAADAMERLGLDAFDAEGNMRPLNEVFKDLDSALSELTDEEKIQALRNIFNKVDLKSAEALLANCGERFDELSGYISASEGAAAEMAETMNDNLKGRITQLGSAAEGLGIQLYKKLEGPLKSAAEAGIKGLSKLTKEISGGQLSTKLDKIGKSAGNLIKSFSNMAINAIPRLINGLSLIIDNSHKIVPAIGAATTAFITFKSAMAVTKMIKTFSELSAAARLFGAGMSTSLSLAQGAVGLLTGQLSLATVAQTGLNTAMMTNPAGLLVAGIMAVVGAFIAYNEITSIRSQKDEEESQRISDLTEKIHEQKDAWDELKDAQNEKIEASVAEIDHMQELKDELEGLIDAEGRVKDGQKDRVAFIVDELNKVMPDSIKWIDDERTAIEMNSDAIDTNLKKKKAALIVEALEPQYKEAILNIQKKLNEQAKISVDIKDKQKEVAEAERDMLEKQGQASHTAYNEAKALYESKKQQLDELETAYNDNETVIRESYEAVEHYEKTAALAAEGNYDVINNAIRNNTEEYKKAGEANTDELKKQADEAQAAYELMAERLKDGVEGVTQEMVDEAKEGAQKTKDEYMNGLEDAVQESQSKYDTLSEQFRKGVYGVTADMVNEAKEGAQSAKDEYINSFKTAMEEAQNNYDALSEKFRNGVDGVTADMVNAAKSNVEAAKSEYLSKLEEIVNEAQGKYEALSEQFKNGVYGVTADMVNEAKEGVQNAKNEYVESLKTIAEEAQSKYDELLEQFNNGVEGITNDMVNNARQGAENTRDEYINSLTETAEEAQNKYSELLSQFKNGVEGVTADMVNEARKSANGINEEYLNSLKKAAFEAQNKYDTLSEQLKNGVKGVTQDMVDEAEKAVQNTSNEYVKSLEKINNEAQNEIAALSELHKKGVEGVTNDMVKDAKKNAKDLKKEFNEVGENIAEGVAEGIKSNSACVSEAAESVVLGARDRAKEVAVIRSPSRLFRDEIGYMLSLGVAEGVNAGASEVYLSISNMSENALDTAKSQGKSYKDVGSIYISELTKGIKSNAKDLDNTIKSIIEENIEAYNEMSEKELKDRIEILKDASDDEIEALRKESRKKQETYKDSAKTLMEYYSEGISEGAENIKSVINEKISAIANEAQARYDDIVKKQENMQKKLADFGELFSFDDEGNLELDVIEDNIAALERYDEALTRIKNKGVSDEFLNKITDLGVVEGAKFAEGLLSLENDKFDKYIKSWEEQQLKAKNIAAKFYADELQAIEKDFAEQLNKAAAEIPHEAERIGNSVMRGLIGGMRDKFDELRDVCDRITELIKSTLSESMEINSPSKWAKRVIGVNTAMGIGVGFEEYMPRLGKSMSKSLKNAVNELSDFGIEADIVGKKAAARAQYTIYNNSQKQVVNNDKGVNMNVNFYNQVKSPADTYRAIKRAGRELCYA